MHRQTQLYRGDGSIISIARDLGNGGEGAVFEVVNSPHVVAKLYHKPIPPRKSAKLLAMATSVTPELRGLAAWPESTIHAHAAGPIVGFIMRRIVGYKEAHHLYGPKSRKIDFPNATWRFLVHAAANFSRAVAVVHDHGHVLGDINHGNVLINNNGVAALIDCDSFQIATSTERYLCEVGVPTYTPPELQGCRFDQVPRTPNHDNFGLAVLVFHLLFMGRHPFAGRFLGAGDMPIERAIREYRFAFGRGCTHSQMQPPPNALSLSILPDDLANTFERAFARGSERESARPSAKEWIRVLETMAKGIRKCHVNAVHEFPTTSAHCPWCQIESRAGVSLFNIIFVHAATGISVEKVWADITSLRLPAAPPLVSPESLLPQIKPSDTARRYGWRRRITSAVAVLVVLFTGVSLIVAMAPASAWLALMTPACVVAFALHRTVDKRVREDAREQCKRAEAIWQTVRTRFESEASDTPFVKMREELESIHRRYVELTPLRQRRYDELVKNALTIQFQRYLESQDIESAVIPKIGPGRKATLRSFGIDSAEDVTETALQGIPGFGPVYVGTLLAWRKFIEKQFRFDPQKAVNPNDVRQLDDEIASKRAHLERSLDTGARTLSQIQRDILKARAELCPQVEAAAREAAEAVVTYRVM